MPRQRNPSGPASMLITCLRNLASDKLTSAQVTEMLAHINRGSKVFPEGKNLVSTLVEDGKDDACVGWHYVHYTVCADKLLFTVTVQTIKSREREPQCQELLDAVPGILASLKRR